MTSCITYIGMYTSHLIKVFYIFIIKTRHFLIQNNQCVIKEAYVKAAAALDGGSKKSLLCKQFLQTVCVREGERDYCCGVDTLR